MDHKHVRDGGRAAEPARPHAGRQGEHRAVVAQPVTFTAAVSANPPGAGTPAGTVAFAGGSTTLGAATLNGSGIATIATSSLAAGSHAITATYGGDGNFAGSSGSLTQTVNKVASSMALCLIAQTRRSSAAGRGPSGREHWS